jgi:hypothetical protein
MKKILFLLLFVASNIIVAQNIAFEQVAIKVKPGSSSHVLNMINDFYGSIEKPAGVNIRLSYINFKPQDIEATHYLTFTGSVEGLSKLREIRGGDKYSLYNSNILRHAEVISTTGGSSLMRMNLDKGTQSMAQSWRWRVEDPASFASEFTALMKAFPQIGYISLGQLTHGIGNDGESHYVYMTHEDYASALGWGPKTEAQQQAFLKFLKATSKYSDFLGSVTMSNVKTW